MNGIIADIASWILIASGSIFLVIGSLGLLRLPDFYSRLHAAGITDTMGATLILGGLIVQAGDILIMIKLAFIIILLLLTSPTATHAIAQAAFQSGLKPWANNAEPLDKDIPSSSI